MADEEGGKAMRIVALIPARAGSKRAVNKNISTFGTNERCKSTCLIRIALDQALEIFPAKDVFLSTDYQDRDLRCWDIYKEIVIRRPSFLAADDTPMRDVVIHAALDLDLESHDWIMLLQPTSPLRAVKDIMESSAFAMGEGCKNYSVTDGHSGPNGAIYCATVSDWAAGGPKNEWTEKAPVGYVLMPPERSIDIDTEEDWKKAQELWNSLKAH